MGGEHEARTPINSSLWTYTNGAGEWLPKFVSGGEAPSARVAHSQCIVTQDGTPYLYVFGGRQGIHMDEAPLNDLHRFDLVKQTWEAVYTGDDAPPPRSFHRMEAIGDSVFVFAGCAAKGRLNDLWRFDTVAGVWSQCATNEAIKGRGGPGFCAVGDKLWVVAGFAGEETDDIYTYDPATDSWENVEPKGEFRKRSVFGHAAVGKHIVVFGGEVDPSERGHEGAGGFSNDVMVFDTVARQWHSASAGEGKLPFARDWSSMAAIAAGEKEGTLLVFGGLAGDDEAPQRLDDTCVLELKID